MNSDQHLLNNIQQQTNNYPDTESSTHHDVDEHSDRNKKTGFNRETDFLDSYDTLFRKSTLKLIISLGRQYSTKFHVRELSRFLHYDVSMISKNLKYLQNIALVTSEDVGNLVFYQANMNNVLLRQMKISFTLLEINELIQKIEPISSSIMLYGSCAIGEDTNASDIDLFIETTDKDRVKEILNNYQRSIDRTLSPVIATPNETYTMKMNDKILFASIRQGIILKGGQDVA